ncbi:NACHT-domain-containing protein, partial [Decorospora gaudefroyi]
MRLLKYGANGELSIAEFDEDTKPAYAILSHRWGAEAGEVTFEDVVGNTGKNKPGYAKIRFCGEQAQRDGLQYFWVDTCCINKANKAELSLAIQSMFRWYHHSARCYVYLSDVSSRPLDTTPACNPQASEFQRTDQLTWIWILLFIYPMFRWYHIMLQRFFVLLNVSGPQAYESKQVQKSEWFTRGWTLQELLAPSSVEFFSREWEKLGDRVSLKSVIHEVTTIPHEVLEGAPISQFSVDERLRWRQTRDTKVEEDAAYSLSGIFNVDMAPVYGEGIKSAFQRLYEKIRQQEEYLRQQEEYLRKCEECLLDLCGTDPRNDKKRIEDTKGGLLRDSYRWVLHNDSFRKWHDDLQSRLLWVKGDPGKGKTMLLCGIIDELQASSTIAKKNTVSYFFCQATDARINSATAVLRGLLYMLVKQQLWLASHVRKKYDEVGKNMFEDANAWIALVDIFKDVLRDSSLTATYLIVDALDECVTDLPKLLDFIAKQSSASSCVKWIVSSRNWPEIEGRLEQAGHKVRLSLELNATSVSTAVQDFIDQRVSKLAQRNKYDEPTQRAVLEHLTSNANDTFLWVALVCQHLQSTAKRNVLRKLELFPPGLDALYEWMMQQISKADDAELCKQVLAAVALVYRPITLKELVILVEPLEGMADDLELREVIGLCGSFLTLREQTVYFVHQSAKDFLLAKAAQDVFPAGRETVHQAIFARSLQIMSTTLRRDMYGLKALGTPIDDVEMPEPDPLAALRYSCVHWVEHLCDSNPTSSATYAECLRGGGVVDRFLQKKCLYWLESLSLCKSMSKGVASVSGLQMLVQEMGEATLFAQLVYDVHRFVMYYKQAIESGPLQAYGSALLFSPKQSVMRKLFQHEGLEGIVLKPGMSDGWSACLQTLEGHSGSVGSVAFSHDSTRLASASYDSTVKIWDASSGACLQTLEGHSGCVSSVAFSHDSTRLASA